MTGRFVSTDPVGFDEQNLHSFNRYAYANNNPYRYNDPDGRASAALYVVGGLGVGLLMLPEEKRRQLGQSLADGIRGLYPILNENSAGQGESQASKPQSPAEVLSPGGQPVGNVEGGATPDVRTVKPGEMDAVIDGLKGLGARPGAKPNYPGDWFDLPNNQGGFGIRDSKSSGRTVDVKIPDVPDVTKIHQKP